MKHSLLVLLIAFAETAQATQLIVKDEKGGAVDGAIFLENYERVRRGQNISRLQYETNDQFSIRRSDAMRQFKNLVGQRYTLVFNDIRARYDWSSGNLTHFLDSRIPLNMPKARGPEQNVQISHAVSDRLGQEIASFPEALTIKMQALLNEFGYVDVIGFSISYRGNEIFSK